MKNVGFVEQYEVKFYDSFAGLGTLDGNGHHQVPRQAVKVSMHF